MQLKTKACQAAALALISHFSFLPMVKLYSSPSSRSGSETNQTKLNMLYTEHAFPSRHPIRIKMPILQLFGFSNIGSHWATLWRNFCGKLMVLQAVKHVLVRGKGKLFYLSVSCNLSLLDFYYRAALRTKPFSVLVENV